MATLFGSAQYLAAASPSAASPWMMAVVSQIRCSRVPLMVTLLAIALAALQVLIFRLFTRVSIPLNHSISLPSRGCTDFNIIWNSTPGTAEVMFCSICLNCAPDICEKDPPKELIRSEEHTSELQ